MATGTQDRTSQQQQGQGSSQGYSDLASNGVGLDPTQIKSLLFADGYHAVSQCELVQFAIGTAHSPIQASNTYPALRFMDEDSGIWVTAPLSQIQAYSTAQSTGISTRSTSKQYSNEGNQAS